MRKYLATLVFGGFALMASPLSLCAATSANEIGPGQTVAVEQERGVVGLRDEAAMLLVGTALIGLAAAVRRAA